MDHTVPRPETAPVVLLPAPDSAAPTTLVDDEAALVKTPLAPAYVAATISTATAAPTLPKVLTPGEVATLLRLRPRSVYEAINRGDIPGVRRIGRKIRVDRDRILEWLANGQGRVSRSSRR